MSRCIALKNTTNNVNSFIFRSKRPLGVLLKFYYDSHCKDLVGHTRYPYNSYIAGGYDHEVIQLLYGYIGSYRGGSGLLVLTLHCISTIKSYRCLFYIQQAIKTVARHPCLVCGSSEVCHCLWYQYPAPIDRNPSASMDAPFNDKHIGDPRDSP
ncbi:hypothetical protein BV22DRAFT_6250 [Leucogyrophana mollusca]|uniref:Uncharacterized protein n=1 Tax=Leucogyrophana mollusca TaxID=85980 RepID=A0ACB8C1G0_9AGAM|nr:hypothetical protein BV22DRAFT_6250 [Leucogyrophana mollusca]